MEEAKKKSILIAVIVVCLVLAGLITVVTHSGGSGIPKYFDQELTWLKCSNPQCGATYQISKRDYFKYIEKHQDWRKAGPPALVCKECGKKTVYRAVKCEKCRKIFYWGSVPGDFEDRCPNCGYSKLENDLGQPVGH